MCSNVRTLQSCLSLLHVSEAILILLRCQWLKTSYSQSRLHESSRKWSIIPSSLCLPSYFKENKRNCKTKHEKHISVVTDNAESSQRVFSIQLYWQLQQNFCVSLKEKKEKAEKVGWVSTMLSTLDLSEHSGREAHCVTQPFRDRHMSVTITLYTVWFMQ